LLEKLLNSFHDYVVVKLDVTLAVGLEVQGFRFNPSGLLLTVVGSCMMVL